MATRNVEVIYEDNHLLAINKPTGLLSQGDETGDITALDLGKDFIKVHYNKPGDVFLGSVHRLDRVTSGSLVMARTSKALSRMNRLFQDRQVQKTYLALVRRRPEEQFGELSHFLLKDRSRNRSRIYEQRGRRTADAKPVKLSYEVAGIIDGLTLLVIKPETGRSHQIRAQLAHIGSPIIGDMKYGYPTAMDDDGIALHGFRLDFVHPVRKEPVTIQAEVPNVAEWRQFKGLIEDL